MPLRPCPGCAAKKAARAIRRRYFPKSDLRTQLHALGLHGFHVRKGMDEATGEQIGWLIDFRNGLPLLPPSAPKEFKGLPVRYG